MADFFNNLLLRSSKPTSGLILRPRLPSLFESMQVINTNPITEAGAMADVTGPNTLSDHIAGNTDRPRPRTDHMAAEKSRTVKPPTSKKASLAPGNKQAGISELQENKFIDKQQVVNESRKEQDGHFIEGTHQTLVETSLQIQPAEVLKPKIESSSQITLQTESMEDTSHSYPEPVLSAPALKSVLPVQSMPAISKRSSTRPEQIQENEMVVQVHIGRIEVRSVNAPVSQPISITNTPSQPKMSLDDYLQKRE